MSAGTDDDRRYTRLALEQAREAYAKGSIPVGSVMVRDGALIAVGRNRSQETNDPTSHAEIDCIRNGGLRDGYGSARQPYRVGDLLMDVGTAPVDLEQRLVVGEDRGQPQLDLRVVADDQAAAFWRPVQRPERPPRAAAAGCWGGSPSAEA
jgi:tRNA(Arg) A34 adenosine deaminase TadA